MAQSKDDDTENNKGQTLPAWPGLPPAQGKDGPDAMKAMLWCCGAHQRSTFRHGTGKR